MTFAPGMKAESLSGSWERDLVSDMRVLREEYGTDVLLSLMENEEYLYYGIPELLDTESSGAESPGAETHAGIEIVRFPIRDMGVPQEAESEKFASFVREVVKRLEAGKDVVAHCRGGLGRTGVVVACVLVALGGHAADEAIQAVRKARRGTVQTEEQAEFIRHFEARQHLA